MSPTRRVLIIEDKQDIRFMISEYFKKRGWETHSAGTGGEGMSRLSELKPDCVILDIQLADMDGFDICKRIKQDTELARSAVVMITGSYRRDEDRMRGLSLGADAYILKPFQLGSLEEQVIAVLKAKR